MARRSKDVDPWLEWAREIDPMTELVFPDMFTGPSILSPFDPWAHHKNLILRTRGEKREAVKREVLEIASRLDAGMSVEEAFALKPIPTKPEPVTRAEFNEQDVLRAKGLGIRPN